MIDAPALLPDGTAPPTGNAALVLRWIGPYGTHGALTRRSIESQLARITKRAPDRAEVDTIIRDLAARDLITLYRQAKRSASPINDDLSGHVDDEDDEDWYVLTPLGRKAARLCAILAGDSNVVGGAATSGAALGDIIIEAIAKHGGEPEAIAAACCCATDDQVAAGVKQLLAQNLVRERDGTLGLLPQGIARQAQLQESRHALLEQEFAEAVAAMLPADRSPGSAAIEPNTSMFDVAIICALHDPELEKVQLTGTDSWEPLPSVPEDPSSYFRTTFTTKAGKRLRVVAAAPTQMGMPASAVLATKVILRFRPKLVAMVGIAAGARRKEQGFGDIIAPDTTFDYNAGKISEREGRIIFSPDPNPIPIHPRLRDLLKHWSKDRRHLDDIYRRWPAQKPSTVLQLHVGPLGSGHWVVDAAQPIQDIIDHWRKLAGVEMEAYGVHVACRDAVDPAPTFLCMKAISDFATNKDDSARDYAAYTAAELCYRFLTEEWENLHLDPRA